MTAGSASPRNTLERSLIPITPRSRKGAAWASRSPTQSSRSMTVTSRWNPCLEPAQPSPAVYLPASNSTLCAEAKAGEGRIREGRGTILFMDDEQSVRETVGMMLRRLGYGVTLVDDGAKAVERYQESIQSNNPFNAVILDLTVPGGMGGKEAIARLGRLIPASEQLCPAVMPMTPSWPTTSNTGSQVWWPSRTASRTLAQRLQHYCRCLQTIVSRCKAMSVEKIRSTIPVLRRTTSIVKPRVSCCMAAARRRS